MSIRAIIRWDDGTSTTVRILTAFRYRSFSLSTKLVLKRFGWLGIPFQPLFCRSCAVLEDVTRARSTFPFASFAQWIVHIRTMEMLWESLESWTITHGGSTCFWHLPNTKLVVLHSDTGNDVCVFMLTCISLEFGLSFDVELCHAAAVVRSDSDFECCFTN